MSKIETVAPGTSLGSGTTKPAATQLRQAIEAGNWKDGERVLGWIGERLKPDKPLFAAKELSEVLDTVLWAARKAEEADQYTWAELALSILPFFGLPFLVDGLTTNDHERFEKAAKETHQRLLARRPMADADIGPAGGPSASAPSRARGGASTPLTGLTEPSAGVRIQRPQGALEGKKFDELIARLGLTQACADGVITAEEAAAIGSALSMFRARAAKSGAKEVIDSYLELAGVTGGAVRPIPAKELLAPTNRFDVIVLAPKRFHDELGVYINHRELGGKKVAVIDPEDVYAHYGRHGAEMLGQLVHDARQQWQEPKPRFVFAIGNPRGSEVPAYLASGLVHATAIDRVEPEDIPTDTLLSEPDAHGVPAVFVGRLPIDTPEQLERYLAKLVANETMRNPSLSSAEAALVDGDPQWNEKMNRVVDWFSRQELSSLPPDRKWTRISDNPANAISGNYPDRVKAQMGMDALYVGYVGHGAWTAIDGFSVTTFASMKDSQRNIVAFLNMVACSTGDMSQSADEPGHELSLAEKAVVDGPVVSSFGASAVTLPMNNPAMAKAVAEEITGGKAETAGEAIVAAKKRFAKNDVGGWSGAMQGASDAAFGLVSLFKGQDLVAGKPHNRELHLYAYNLFGDPAAQLRRPKDLPHLFVPGLLNAGEPFALRVKVPPGVTNGTLIVDVEKPLGETLEPLEDVKAAALAPEEIERRKARNAERVNQRGLVRIILPIRDGKVVGSPALPPRAKPGTYNVRVTLIGDTEIYARGVEHVRVHR